MNKIVASFDYQTPLHEIVNKSEPGVLFFQNHNHSASYQLIIQSIDEFAKNNVKHLYLEITTLFNESLAEHRKGKNESLDYIIKHFIDPIPKTYLKKLIEKANSVGIKVFAVDPTKTGFGGDKTIGNEKEQQKSLQKRASIDEDMTINIRKYTKLLGKGEKFIGLFGSSHQPICDKSHLNTPSVFFHAHDGLEESFLNFKPSEIDALTEKERKHLDSFDIVILALPDLEDELDMTKEVSNGSGIKLLNQFLRTYDIPITCKGFAHTNTPIIDGVVVVDNKNSISTWEKICKLMNPIGKRQFTEETQTTIIFQDVESQKTCHLLLQGILAKKQPLQKK